MKRLRKELVDEIATVTTKNQRLIDEIDRYENALAQYREDGDMYMDCCVCGSVQLKVSMKECHSYYTQDETYKQCGSSNYMCKKCVSPNHSKFCKWCEPHIVQYTNLDEQIKAHEDRLMAKFQNVVDEQNKE